MEMKGLLGMGTERIIGYVLLGAGLAIVTYSVVMAYSYLVGVSPVPHFFETPEIDGSTISSSLFTDTSNVLMLSTMLVIIIFAGSVISSRGVSLIKEIKMKVIKEIDTEISTEKTEEVS